MAQIPHPDIRNLLSTSPKLASALGEFPITALDIGARRGFTDDLLPLAPAIDAIGFEPDEEECAALNRDAATSAEPWRSIRFVPVALGPADEEASLNLYRQRGCSSLLEADPALVSQFARGDDYILEGQVPVEMVPLDAASVTHGFTGAAYIKIDVQGFERQVFETGKQLLSNSILAIRSEVTAIPLYKNMPLIEDVIAYLRPFGFVPMGFEEIHDWRRTTRVKHPRRSPGPIPFSRGQLIHGDILFFRDPDLIADDVGTLLRAAFLALAYGFVDHAQALMQRTSAAAWLKEHHDLDIARELDCVSVRHARIFRSQQRRNRMADFRFRLKQSLRF